MEIIFGIAVFWFCLFITVVGVCIVHDEFFKNKKGNKKCGK